MSKTLEEQLRTCLLQDGRSLYELQAESGVDRGVLSRFIAGERTITLRTAGHIARTLRLELKRTNRKARR